VPRRKKVDRGACGALLVQVGRREDMSADIWGIVMRLTPPNRCPRCGSVIRSADLGAYLRKLARVVTEENRKSRDNKRAKRREPKDKAKHSSPRGV
jgi:uncharacterized C2H2 Zn-finger protein